MTFDERNNKSNLKQLENSKKESVNLEKNDSILEEKPEKEEEVEEKLPIDKYYEVIKHKTINKSGNWWSAVVLVKDKGRNKIFVYLWNKRSDEWKRKQKFMIRNKEDYKEINKAIQDFILLL